MWVVVGCEVVVTATVLGGAVDPFLLHVLTRGVGAGGEGGRGGGGGGRRGREEESGEGI